MDTFEIPQFTLGWGVLDWGSTYLAQPDDIGGEKGGPWVYTNEQAQFILKFYEIDQHGRFVYRRAMLSRAKGWGKSPLLAAIACTELLGPVRFAGWNAKGQPVGKPFGMPSIVLAAVKMEQAENTMSLVREMLLDGKASQHYDIDVGLTRVRSGHGGSLRPVAVSPRGIEGERPTFTLLDETHHWIATNHGIEFANTLRRNLGKVGGRSIETTNAPVPGEGSVAEVSDIYWDRIKTGKLDDQTFLYDSTEVTIEDIYDKEKAWPALREAYGDAKWIDLDRIWAEINDPATSEADARRFYFNQRVLRGSQWLNPLAWRGCKSEAIRPLARTDRIALGFRGQTRNGAVGIVACRLEDNALFVLKSWETNDNQPEISHKEVDDYVKLVFDVYTVVLCYAAPQNWQDIVGRWYEANEDVVEEFWTSQRLRYAKAVEQFETAVYANRLVHNGDEVLKQHIENAQTEELPGELKIIRRSTPHSKYYISVAEAAVLAFDAAQEAIQRGLDSEGSDNHVYSF